MVQIGQRRFGLVGPGAWTDVAGGGTQRMFGRVVHRHVVQLGLLLLLFAARSGRRVAPRRRVAVGQLMVVRRMRSHDDDVVV